MAWTVELDEHAARQVSRLDRAAARRVVDYLRDISQLDDPRSRGRALSGTLAGLWRYRVGDYRVVAVIDDARLVVIAVEVAHRSTVYRPHR